MIQPTEFKNAMSLLSSAVSIVTTAGEHGAYGFTASAVCAVAETPATLLVCINKAARSHPQFLQNKILCVNVLAAQHAQLATAFSTQHMSPEARFKQAIWTQLHTGAPVLVDAMASFDCEIAQYQHVATHTIMICRIVAIRHTVSDQALVYFKRTFYALG